MKEMKKNITISIIFFILLFLPTADNYFDFSPVKQIFEKRKAVKKPEFPKKISQIKYYFEKFEKFYNDNYGLRKSLISLNGFIMDNIFNESPDERAVIGIEGWLYFDNKDSLLDFQGLAKISDKKVDILAENLIENWRQAKKRNINYMLAISADKSSIYPEFLPKYIKYSKENHRIDKLIHVLKKKSPNFPILDLRKILILAKSNDNEILYHKTDTHWNRRGAFYGYKHIMKNFKLPYNKIDQFTKIENGFYKGDISYIMNSQQRNINYDLKAKFKKNWTFLDPKIEEIKKFRKSVFFTNKNKKLPVLFVYKDSFFDNMLFFFAQNFSNSYFINEFPCKIDFSVTDKYKPNFLIQEFWESRVSQIADKCKS